MAYLFQNLKLYGYLSNAAKCGADANSNTGEAK